MESSSVNFGRSIIVPSVLELAKRPGPNIPLRYQRTDREPVAGESGPSVPVLDLDRLIGLGDSAGLELEKLHFACKDWGFFQIINHGVPTSMLKEFRIEIESLFNLPYEEKKLLWQNPQNQEGFGQLFVVSEEQKLDWSDMFFLTTLPLHLRNPHLFQNLPPKLRDTLEAYSTEVEKLAIVILDQLAGALKMNVEEMRELFRDGVQTMRMNYYPPCPEPDKAIGFSAHSDADALTIVYQLNETEGLEIRKDGKWVVVKPLPNAFVANIGDILEIVSNGVYKSIEHRVSSNCSKERLSVATFYSSNLDSELGPANSLVGLHSPAVFRRVTLEKYLKEFFARKLEGKSYLEHMRIDNEDHDHGTIENFEPTMLQLGDSLLVPSVQELAKSSPSSVPLRYVWPDQDPPFEFTDTSSQIPVIDLHKLLFSNNVQDSELDRLHHACKDWGFFQLINHGVNDVLVENIKSGIEDLFNLSMEEKRKLWQKPGDFEGFGQSFVVSEEQKLNWGDIFGMFMLPVYLRKPHLFPNLPLPFRDDLDAYALEMKNLATKLLDLLAKALKMEGSEMRELLGDEIISTRMNYYPPCPQPELVIGFNNHSDASAITILLQVNEMEGLQIRKDGKWILVKPLPNAFVVNIGDVLEIVTNGIYRSIEHRVTVNSAKERVSMAIFCIPRLDGEIGPAPSLVTSESPALFKRVGVTDFLKGFFSKELNGKSYLDAMRIQNDGGIA